MKNFLLEDSTGEKSVTMTAFVIGFLIVNIKLILSGFTIGHVTFNVFTGGEYAAALGSLGAIYVLRRSTDRKKERDVDEILKK